MKHNFQAQKRFDPLAFSLVGNTGTVSCYPKSSSYAETMSEHGCILTSNHKRTGYLKNISVGIRSRELFR